MSCLISATAVPYASTELARGCFEKHRFSADILQKPVNLLSGPRRFCRKKAASRGKRERIACESSVAGSPAAASKTAALEKVYLGASKVAVTPLGIGAWSWGDTFFWNEGSWTDQKLKQAKQAFEQSVGSGLTFFDTAEVYGTQALGGENSERILGRFIKETRAIPQSEIVVATKFAALPFRFGRASVVKALQDSLKRLDLPSVDLYQIHWPGLWQNEEYWDGLADCVDKGLAQAVGVSNYNEKAMREVHAKLAARGIPLASNQVHYNLLYRNIEESGVKAACKELNVSIIAYSPIAQGALSGKYTPENPPKGPRGGIFSPDYLRKVAPVVAKLTEIGDRYGGKTPVQVALNWLIVQGNCIPIPGAKNKQQAEEFMGALGWSMTPEEAEELRTLAKAVPKYAGPPVGN